MALNTQTIELDVAKPLGNRQIVRVAQGDDGGCTLKALLYDNGSELSLTNTSVYLVVKLPDKAHYYMDKCAVSGNTATITLNEEKLCSVPGFTDEAYFEVIKNSQTSSTERFCMDIIPSALDGHEPAEDWNNAIQKLIKDGSAAANSANTAATNATAAASSANSAASAATEAASSANSAAASATSAASSATSAANSATSAASSATKAASAANTAATKATSSAEAADKAAAACEEATTEAKAATTQAEGAATNATAAATAAELIVNNLKSVSIDESNASKLDHEVSVLGSAVADLKDDYILIGERIFVPASRVTSNSGEKLALSKATAASGEKITLT